MLADPVWERSEHTERGRDGCRVPIPWTPSGPSFGFGSAAGWLPQPAGWGSQSVQAQQDDPASMLRLYLGALQLRRTLPALGAAREPGGPAWLD
ncbi:MAG TPA: alpha-amylase, partial [Actinomycetes bacterium]|nr:alpha-amylase [Actinomycetes bacterium]